MSRHQPFSFSTSEELKQAAESLRLDLPFQEDLSPLFSPLFLKAEKLPNRLVVHPMEGFDAHEDGSPSDLTARRYKRYARGGSAVIWFEAASVCQEGRSNPHQLYIHENNLTAFRALVDRTRAEAQIRFGTNHNILCILQLTHSGRYSKPLGIASPMAADANPILDRSFDAVEIISDAGLKKATNDFVIAAALARDSGFDGVDIKACHGYLVNDLLSARSRPGPYGGNLSGRTRFLKEIIEAVQSEFPGMVNAIRLSVGDGIPFPYDRRI